jgi:hypothetical protein
LHVKRKDSSGGSGGFLHGEKRRINIRKKAQGEKLPPGEGHGNMDLVTVRRGLEELAGVSAL